MSTDFYPHCCFGILLTHVVPGFVEKMTPQSLRDDASPDTDEEPGPWDENWERDMLEEHGEALCDALREKGIIVSPGQLETNGGSLSLIWTGEDDERRADRKFSVPAETWILGLGLLKNPTHYQGEAGASFWQAGSWHLWTTFG